MHRVSWDKGLNVGQLLLILVAVLPGCAAETCPAIDTKDMAQYENADPDVFADCNGENPGPAPEGVNLPDDISLVYVRHTMQNAANNTPSSLKFKTSNLKWENAGGNGGGGTKTAVDSP